MCDCKTSMLPRKAESGKCRIPPEKVVVSGRNVAFRVPAGTFRPENHFPVSGFRLPAKGAARAQDEGGGESALSRFPLSGLNQRTARAPQRVGGGRAILRAPAVENSSPDTGNRKVPVSGFRFPAALLSPCLSCSHHARQPSTVFQIRSHTGRFLPKLSTFQLPASVYFPTAQTSPLSPGLLSLGTSGLVGWESGEPHSA